MLLDDLIVGWQFMATMSPNVPLSVLRHHGEVHPGPADHLPHYANDRSQGVWIPKTKRFRELGIDIDEPRQTMASQAGQVDPAEFLPFLISYREIVEGGGTAEERQRAIRDLHSNPIWSVWLDKLRL